jgi:hypothetical protein
MSEYQTVTRYRTPDGVEHDTEAAAAQWNRVRLAQIDVDDYLGTLVIGDPKHHTRIENILLRFVEWQVARADIDQAEVEE